MGPETVEPQRRGRAVGLEMRTLLTWLILPSDPLTGQYSIYLKGGSMVYPGRKRFFWKA